MKRSAWKSPVVLLSAGCLSVMVLSSPFLLRFFLPVQDFTKEVLPQGENPPVANPPKKVALAATILQKEKQPDEVKQPAGGFAFREDGSGKELAQKLPPAAQTQLPSFPANKPLPRVIPAALKNPAPPLALAPVKMPNLPPGGSAAVSKPGAVPEEMPLIEFTENPPVPEISKLDVSPAISVPSLDVNKPPVLVQVKHAVPDVVAVMDPTQDASQQAALEGSPPPRMDAAPFLRLTLPDPFANRKVPDLFEPAPEENTPITGSPVVPAG